MKHINLDNVEIPALGYGTWQEEGDVARRAVREALDIGYRHIDTAQAYGNEQDVGTAIKDSGVDREKIFLTTKIWRDNVANGDLQQSFDESLRKLQTDYVDLLLIHWPVEGVPFAEQMKALSGVQEAGKTRLIGVSNFTVAQMKHVREELGTNIITNQVEYHPFIPQDPVLDYIRGHDMFLTAYSPVARGKVFGNTLLKEIGRKYNKNEAQVALRWLMQQDHVAAIPKAAKREHMQSNFEIFDFELTKQELEDLRTLASPEGRLISPDFAPDWDTANVKKAA